MEKKAILLLSIATFLIIGLPSASAQMVGLDTNIVIECDKDTYVPDLWAADEDWRTLDIFCNVSNSGGNTKNKKIGYMFDDWLEEEVQIIDVWTMEEGETEWTSIKPNMNKDKPATKRTRQLSQQNIQVKAGENVSIWVKITPPASSYGKFDVIFGEYSLDPWWNVSYGYRQEYTFKGNGRNLTAVNSNYPYGYPMNITLNTQTLIAGGKMDSYCRDLEVGINDTEDYFYPRFIRFCNTDHTEIWFGENWTAGEESDYRTYYIFYDSANLNIGVDPMDIVYLHDEFEDVDDSINPYDINNTLFTGWYKRAGQQFGSPTLEVTAARSGSLNPYRVTGGRLELVGGSGNSGAWLWHGDLYFNMSSDGLLVETEYEYSECCTCCDYTEHRSTTVRKIVKPDTNVCSVIGCDAQHYGQVHGNLFKWSLQSLSGNDFKWFAVKNDDTTNSPGWFYQNTQNLIPDSYSYAWWMGSNYQGIKAMNLIFNPDSDTFSFYSNYGSSNKWNGPLSISGTPYLSDAFFQNDLTYNNTIEIGSAKGCSCGNIFGRYPYYFARPWQPDEPTLTLTGSEIPLDAGNLDLQFISPTPANGSTISNETCSIVINVSSNKTLDSCTLDWNGVNESMTTMDLFCYATKSVPSPTTISYEVYGEDIYGFENVTGTNSFTFALPGGTFQIVLTEPGADDIFYSYTNNSHGFDFNFSTVQTGTEIEGCAAYGNWTGTWHQNVTNQSVIINGTGNIINVPYLPWGDHVVNVGCWNDTDTVFCVNRTIHVYGSPAYCDDMSDCNDKLSKVDGSTSEAGTIVYLTQDTSGGSVTVPINITFDGQGHTVSSASASFSVQGGPMRNIKLVSAGGFALITFSSSAMLYNVELDGSGNTQVGLRLEHKHYINVTNVTLYNFTSYGVRAYCIYTTGSCTYNNFTHSRFYDMPYAFWINDQYNVMPYGPQYWTLYDNFYNVTNVPFTWPYNAYRNVFYLNVTPYAATNIIGGSYIGGSYIGKEDSTGCSDTNWDADGDSIIDTVTRCGLGGGYNMYDYAPLTYNVDLTAPNITLYQPENISYTECPIYMNFTVGDQISGVDTCWYQLNDDDNVSFTNCENQTFGGEANLDDGLNHVIIWVNDTAGHEAAAEQYFTTEFFDYEIESEVAVIAADAYIVAGEYVTMNVTINASGLPHELNYTLDNFTLDNINTSSIQVINNTGDSISYTLDGNNITFVGCTASSPLQVYFDVILVEQETPSTCPAGYSDYGTYCRRISTTDTRIDNDFYYVVSVTSNISKDYNISLEKAKSVLYAYDGYTYNKTFAVDGQESGVDIDDATDDVKLVVTTDFGASSLEYGVYEFVLSYSVPRSLQQVAGLGGTPTVCGNHICEYSETKASCPTDCNLTIVVKPVGQILPLYPGSKFACSSSLDSCQLIIENPNVQIVSLSIGLLPFENDNVSYKWMEVTDEVSISALNETTIDVTGMIPEDAEPGIYSFVVTMLGTNVEGRDFLMPFEVKAESKDVWTSMFLFLGRNIQIGNLTVPVYGVIGFTTSIVILAGMLWHVRPKKHPKQHWR